MKHLTKVLFIVLAVVCFSNVNAQDKDNRWIVEIGTNVVDFYPTDADPGLDDLSPEKPHTTTDLLFTIRNLDTKECVDLRNIINAS